MTKQLQTIRGMNDILPEMMPYWHYLENCLRELVTNYGYEEIRTPLLEYTELFKRSIGEVTDIVEKEMYTFNDRNNDSLTLRPEGTASVVRAGIQHGLFYNQVQRLWYLGPIYRHERPQRGRYREFYQFGVEAIGMSGPAIDAELIFMNAYLWKRLGLMDALQLQINSLGSLETRNRYRQVLIEYFSLHQEQLDEDSQRRLHTNPLRILDSKNPSLQTLIANAPKLTDYLDETAANNFENLKQLLTAADIQFVVNPQLVRGLDYYTETVFEWVTTSLGAQGTVAAGGRYDGLINQLGGASVPAVGFAMGMERVIELLTLVKPEAVITEFPDVYFIMMSDEAVKIGIILAEQIRKQIPTIKLMTHLSGGGFKSQFKKADKSGARVALILGEEEVKAGTIGFKYLREEKLQETIQQTELMIKLKEILEF